MSKTIDLGIGKLTIGFEPKRPSQSVAANPLAELLNKGYSFTDIHGYEIPGPGLYTGILRQRHSGEDAGMGGEWRKVWLGMLETREPGKWILEAYGPAARDELRTELEPLAKQAGVRLEIQTVGKRPLDARWAGSPGEEG